MSVSIIMKTLNEERGIASAIESALQALPGGAVEVIIADSGSSDRTIEIARTYPVKVVQISPPARPSCGIGPQLGFQYSGHDLICLMDGDMLLDREFLTRGIAYLDAHVDVAGVTGHVQEMNLENLEFIRRVQRGSPENRAGCVDRMNGGGLYRRAAIADAGYFSDRNLHGYEEFDLGVRLRHKGWRLFRMDLPFARHYGHTVNAYRLLVRRWRSKYLRGVGELLRASIGKPYMGMLLAELPELRLWAVVYMLTFAIVACLIAISNKGWAALAALALASLPIAAMSLKHRSVKLGLYAVVAWCFHAAALPLGFFSHREKADAWIESHIISDGTQP